MQPANATQTPREADVERLASALYTCRWIPHTPTPHQLRFLVAPEREALYGGAAGGGKSDALLMGALMFADVPGYSAILFRRTFADLSLPGALIPRSHEWLANSGAAWNEQKKQWKFPSGATLQFGYLEHKNDIYRYQSSEFQFVGFDELTQFSEESYLYVSGSRMRRLASMDIPLRTRAATNPGGPGHQWVYQRFIAAGAQWPYVAAKLDDNPHIDRAEYRKSLAELDPVTRMQLEDGVWATDPRAHAYLPEWWAGKNRFAIEDPTFSNACVARYLSYDTATKTESHNAYTALKVGELTPNYRLILRHSWKDRIQGVTVADHIVQHAERWNYDGKLCGIIIEDQDSGSTAIQGLKLRHDWISDLVIPFHPAKFGDKLFERPQRAALWCQRDCVWMPNPHEQAAWLKPFCDELFTFPDSTFKDDADSFAQLIIFLEHYLAEGWRSREGLA